MQNVVLRVFFAFLFLDSLQGENLDSDFYKKLVSPQGYNSFLSVLEGDFDFSPKIPPPRGYF